MRKKKHRIFLWIGLGFFAISFVMFCVGIGVSYYEFKVSSSNLTPNDLIDSECAFVEGLFAYIFFGTPALLLELSCIKSIYRIMKYNPIGVTRICWLVSAMLSFFAFVFLSLTFTGVLDFTKGSYSLKLQETVLLLTGWPIFITSFILGSIPIKVKTVISNSD